jgi:prolyl oligopeptidase
MLVLTGWLVARGGVRSTAAEPEAGAPNKELHELLDAEWQWTLEEDPTWASSLGDLRYNDRWEDVSLAAQERRQAHRVELLGRLDQIDVEALSHADKINYRLFRREVETAVEAYPFGWYLLPLTQRGGIQDASSLADSLRFDSADDYEDWIARIRGLPVSMEQTIGLMRKGLAEGMVHPKVVMGRVPDQIKRQIVDDVGTSLYFKPFLKFPEKIGADERERLADEAKKAIGECAVPAYRRMLTFFEEEYLPGCLDKVGIWQLPRGERLYAFRARQFTTTDLAPEEIHRLGLKEVERIRAEMEAVIAKVEWPGTFKEFLEHLRTDPKFYFDDPQDLLREYRAICKRIDPELVRLFGKLPRIPYGVEPIPEHLAPDTTTAYYRQPAADGSRAGTYFVNLYRPECRPKFEMEVLSAHEAVPGHHLQIALAMELGNLPEFRRYGGYTAFVEGWGLYSEGLGEDLGLYRDPYSKFGQLTYEMWRAVRLVVDTGIHRFRWTRQQAIDFFAANTPKTMLDIENEVDRYIAWPGQALAYKIGQLKIAELRRRAESELGEKFDVADFHDLILAEGAVTLDVLESNVEAWITRVKKAP